MANSKLTQAKNLKNDEFYTQWTDIEREIQAYLEFNPDVFRGKTILCPCDDPYESNFFKYFALHFNDLGLKKLISTCYASSSVANTQLSLFDDEPMEDKTTKSPHKIEITETVDYNCDGAFDLADVESLLKNKKNVLTRLKGDGDFRSNEVTKLRNEADIIITNPPFSLFREFLAWITEAKKQFLVIANQNAITYKEIFPLIKNNNLWLGKGFTGGAAHFINKHYEDYATASDHKEGMIRVSGVVWFTNLEHGRRHQPLQLMTMAKNLKYNSRLIKKLEGRTEYDKYDNYDAIEVPYTDAIPSDYDGVMGVPISFLEKYCPEQFEIMGMCENLNLYSLKTRIYTTAECRQAYLDKFKKKGTYDLNASGVIVNNGLFEKVYQRILIKKKESKE